MSEEKQNITIPLELFEGRFKVEEVGAICILLAAPHIQKENLDKWGNDDTLAKTINRLISEKAIIIEKDEQGNKITTIYTEKNMKKESTNVDVRRALKELSKNHGYLSEDLEIIQEYMEEVAFSSYTKGYDDARIDYVEPSYTSYGHKEDYV